MSDNKQTPDTTTTKQMNNGPFASAVLRTFAKSNTAGATTVTTTTITSPNMGQMLENYTKSCCTLKLKRDGIKFYLRWKQWLTDYILSWMFGKMCKTCDIRLLRTTVLDLLVAVANWADAMIAEVEKANAESSASTETPT